MKRNIKRISIIIFIFLLFVVLAGLFIIDYNDNDTNIDKDVLEKKANKPESAKQVKLDIKAKPALQCRLNLL